jgi:hypothetical protein
MAWRLEEVASDSKAAQSAAVHDAEGGRRSMAVPRLRDGVNF